MISMKKYTNNIVIIMIIHINIQNNTNIQKLLTLGRKMNNMKGILCDVWFIGVHKVNDIYMSIMYDSITRLYIIRVVTITLLLRIVLIIVKW